MRSGAVSDTMSDAADKAVAQSLVVAVPVIGVIYNAILAFMAAHGVPMNNSIVVAIKVAIIFAALGR